jgi:pseudouridine-5'-phosphate glycosidase
MIPLIYAPEVAEARRTGKPLVALESTIITHGMPFPENYETARTVEAAIREADAVPATCAVLGGHLHIGLTDAHLKRLAQAKGVAKLSRADLPAAIAARATGATTVAATMIAARLAGIEVFATGGIGGVHRGAEHSFDVSADLRELSETPVTVVSAGAKAILDLPKTLEVLETLGVPVIAYGPARVSRLLVAQLGLKAPLRLDSAAEIAAAHRMRRLLGLPGGQLVANPIPAEADDPEGRDRCADSLGPAGRRRRGVRGKAVTPFLLDRVRDLTGGRTLQANIALVLNNARLAARLPKRSPLCRPERGGAHGRHCGPGREALSSRGRPHHLQPDDQTDRRRPARLTITRAAAAACWAACAPAS